MQFMDTTFSVFRTSKDDISAVIILEKLKREQNRGKFEKQ